MKWKENWSISKEREREWGGEKEAKKILWRRVENDKEKRRFQIEEYQENNLRKIEAIATKKKKTERGK